MINENKVNAFVEEFYKNHENVRLNKWNYEDGCILMAAIQLYEATGKNLFRDFIVSYLDEYVEEDGTIKHFKLEDYNLDNIAPGRALIFAYEQTGNEKFYKAVEVLVRQLGEQPRTASGNFWHKKYIRIKYGWMAYTWLNHFIQHVKRSMGRRNIIRIL